MINLNTVGWITGSNSLGKETDNGIGVHTQVLILGVIVLTISVIIGAMIAVYFMKFKNVKTKKKIYGKMFLIGLTVATTLATICGILGLVFFTTAKTIFYDSSSETSGASTAFAVIVSVLAIGFAIVIGIVLILWFKLPHLGIALDGSKINFMGESIAYSKINKIIDDKGSIFINYFVGKKSVKRIRISKTSVLGQWVIQNIEEATKLSIESLDADKYFKELSSSMKK